MKQKETKNDKFKQTRKETKQKTKQHIFEKGEKRMIVL